MTGNEAVEAYLKVRDKVLFVWQWYVTGLAIVSGWALSSGGLWSLEKKAGVTLLVAAFVGMNASGMVRVYRLQFAAHRDLEEANASTGGAPTHLRTALLSLRYPKLLLGIAYVAGLAVALAFVWMDF